MTARDDGADDPVLHLTPRQRDVVELRLRRLGRREIAHRLGITPRCVRSHLDDARRRNGLQDELALLIAVALELRGRSAA